METARSRRNPAWKWNSTWRSEIDWKDLKLSRSMRTTLRQLRNELTLKRTPPKSTTQALRQRGLVDHNCSLTEAGWVAALITAPLHDQCTALNLSHETLNLKRSYDDPALDVMYFLVSQGYRCSYDEGAVIRKVLYCSYFHRLPSLTKAGWEYFMEGMATSPLAIGKSPFDFEEYARDHKSIGNDLKEAVATVTRDEFQNNFRTLFKKGFCWLGADEIFATQVFDYLGTGALSQLLDTLLMDPYTFSQGWPDLTTIGDEGLQLVEVKEQDKLTVSQLITIPAIARVPHIGVKVLSVVRTP